MRIPVKYLSYAAVIWIVYSMQTAAVSFFKPFGVGIDYIPVVLGCICVFENIYPAAFLGLWAGFLCDTVSASGIFWMITYFFATAAVSYIVSLLFYPKPLVCAGACAALLILPDALRCLLFYMPIYDLSIKTAMITSAVKFLFASAAFFPIFLLCRTLSSISPVQRFLRSSRDHVFILKRTVLNTEGFHAKKK